MKKYIQLLFNLFIILTLPSANAELRDPTRPAITSAGENAANANNGYELTGILISGDHRIAVINGHYYKVGDRVLGEQIELIEDNFVQLEGADGKMTLFLFKNTVRRATAYR